MRRPLVCIAFLFATLPAFSVWNQAALEQAATQAKDTLNALIDGHGPLIEQLGSAEAANRILSGMRFGAGTPRDFAHLENPAEVIRIMLDNYYFGDAKNRIGYQYLAARKTRDDVHNSFLLDSYETILQISRYARDDSSEFALQALSGLCPQLTGERKTRCGRILNQYRFRLLDVAVNRHQDRPEICLRFNQAVRPQPAQDWAAMIRFTPEMVAKGQYRNERLCYPGTWRQSYSLSLSPDLQAQYTHLALGEVPEQKIYTGDRAPMLRFGKPGTALDLKDSGNIEIQSANVARIKVGLWQIPANNLANEDLRKAIERPAEFYARNRKLLEDNLSELYQGHFDILDPKVNETVSSNVAFADLLGAHQKKPGVYVMTIADPADPYAAPQTLGFTVSDTGLSAYLTPAGLWIEARDLSAARPVAGREFTLYAYNNAVLGTTTTDTNGMAHFPQAQINGTAGDRPSHIIGRNDGNLTYLSVRGQGYDLADKGLDGVPGNPVMSAWAWQDRGVYRPDDRAHLLWLFKTPDGKAYHAAPLWLRVVRPDGSLVTERTLAPDASGAYLYSHHFSRLARLGNWTLRLSLGKDGPQLAKTTLRVGAIVPRQIETRLRAKAAPQPDRRHTVDFTANWLYGAPGANLPVRAQWTVTTDKAPFPRWNDWQIGEYDEVAAPVNSALPDAVTDPNGRSIFHLTPVVNPLATQPQRLIVRTSLLPPTGNPIAGELGALITRKAPYALLKAQNDRISAALIDARGVPVAGTLTWRLQRLDHDYYWYYADGRWRFQDNSSRSDVLHQGTLNVTAARPAQFTLPIAADDWRDYVVSVTGAHAQSAASLQIGHAGTLKGGNADPARITLSSDKTLYAPKEVVKLHLRAPFDGPGSVQLATTGIVKTYPVTFRKGRATLSLKWKDHWKQGLWVLANGWNETQDGKGDRRAVGLLWLGQTPQEEAALTLQSDLPARHDPADPLEVNLHVTGAKGRSWVNVAVIDDGLYQLARATFSDPVQAFFGKKRWALSLFDVWGGIIGQTGGHRAVLRSGAGETLNTAANGLAALPNLDVEPISYWSGPRALDENANLRLRIPVATDFSGRLRLMVAAFNDTQLGSLEKTVRVTSPLVGTLYFPPYLTVGDRSDFQLRLHNTSDKKMKLHYRITSSGLSFPAPRESELTLGADESRILDFPYRAQTAGTARLAIVLDSPGIARRTLEKTVAIRASALPEWENRYTLLKAGDATTLDFTWPTQLIPMTDYPWQADAVRRQLRDRPWHGSEQLSAKIWGLFDRREQRLSYLSELSNRQEYDGSFSLWGNGNGTLWLSAYIGELMLTDARPPYGPVRTRALDYLRRQVLGNQVRTLDAGLAYAHLVLAKAGASTRGALIRYVENLPKTLPLVPSSLNLVLALGEMGENQRARQLLQRISAVHGQKGTPPYYSDATSRSVESLLRLLQLQKTLGETAPPMVSESIGDLRRQLLDTEKSDFPAHSSSLSLAWMSRINRSFPASRARLLLDGRAISGMTKVTGGEHRLQNPGKTDVLVLSRHLRPVDPAVTREKGIRAKVQVTDFAGRPVDPQALPVNEDLLVRVVITRDKAGRPAEVLFSYPLSAAVSAPAIDRNGNHLTRFSQEKWYRSLAAPEYQENRDDRHLAVFHLGEDDGRIEHAFIIRVTRTGHWTAPGVRVESLYRTGVFARYPARTLHVPSPR